MGDGCEACRGDEAYMGTSPMSGVPLYIGDERLCGTSEGWRCIPGGCPPWGGAFEGW